jgi:hypothetical protein
MMVKVAVIETSVKNTEKTIKSSILAVANHIKSGQAWRIGIVGVAGMVIIQSLILASMWGRLCRTVEVNSERIVVLEALHPRSPK